jgi:hypothetical protein
MKDLISMIFLFALISCNQNKQSAQNANDNVVSNTADSIADKPSGHYMEFCTISDRAMWLRVSPYNLKTDQLKRLTDAYNAAAAIRQQRQRLPAKAG